MRPTRPLLLVVMMCGLAAAAPPKDITGYYDLLVKAGFVEVPLRYSDHEWRYGRREGASELQNEQPPVVDVKNGYIELVYGLDACDRTLVQAALFVAKTKRFMAVSERASCMESDRATVEFFAFDGGKPKRLSAGALGGLTIADFLDEKFVEDEEVPSGEGIALIEYDLPRKGTTVIASLEVPGEPPTGVEQGEWKAVADVVRAHRKYFNIELAWVPAEATFKVLKKLAK